MAVRIQLRRDTLTNWSTNNPTLAEGEMGLEKDTGRWKVGNGLDTWNALPYSNAQASESNPLALGIVAQGTSTRYARQDHVHPTTGLGLTSGTLAQFAATTSAELAGVISDETGSGSLVFSASPAFTGAPTTPDPTIATGIANKRYVDTVSINVQTASYSLALTDSGKLIEMDSSNPNIVTIPLDSSINFDIGTSIDVYQYGTGQTTIAGDIGVTIRSSGNKLNLTSQYSAATLVKRAANDWVVMGDLS